MQLDVGSSDDDDQCPMALPLAGWSETEAIEPAHGAEITNDGACVASVPVTLITGYLGAGKTTLVNFLLTAKHGCRCAVLLNEIGDSADVERALVKEPEGGEAAALADWVELENGCICCSSKNDMVKALEALMQQRDRFDYIIIETTGLANPGPVAAALWTDSELESSVCLDAVVTVVDAKNILRQLADTPPEEGAVNEAQQQIAFADVVLLNKVDLVGPQQLKHILQEIAAINADAAMLPCQHCEVDLHHILNTGIYSGSLRGPGAADPDAATHATPAGDGDTAGAGGRSSGGWQHSSSDAGSSVGEGGAAGSAHSGDLHGEAGCAHAHGDGEEDAPCEACGGVHHQHHLRAASRVGTVSLVLRHGPLDLRRLLHWLDALLWEERSAERPDVFRVKGLLWVQGSERKHVCQGVYDVYDVVEGAAWQGSEERYSKLVFIGRRLDRQALEGQLVQCVGEMGDASRD